MKPTLELITAILSSGKSPTNAKIAFKTMQKEYNIPTLPAAIMAVDGLDSSRILRYQGYLKDGYDEMQSAFMSSNGSTSLKSIYDETYEWLTNFFL